MGKPTRTSPRGRLAIALFLALGLLGVTVVDALAAPKPKMSCADASWDCLLIGNGKHVK